MALRLAVCRPDRAGVATAAAAIVAALLVATGCTTGGDAAAPPSEPTTTAAPTTSTTPPTPTCPDVVVERDGAARIADAALEEVSGAAVSSRDPEVVWVIEDSGNPSTITALSPAGDTLSAVAVSVANTDWEDLSILAGPDGGTIVVADIGDNAEARASISLVRLTEPDPAAAPSTADPEIVTLRPPTPANAEALLVDPLTDDVIIVTKALDGTAQVLVAEGAATAPAGSTVELVDAGRLELGPLSAVLAGDVAPDGTAVALRTPSRVLWWSRDPARSVADTLLRSDPCPLPSPLDPYGEALALRTADCFLATGEGANPSMVWIGPDQGC